MNGKFINFFRKKENVEILRSLGQVFVFILIVLLILFLYLLITPELVELKTILSAVCILVALLIVLVISGGIEISIGDLFKIKRDTEEIKKEVEDLKFIISNKNSNTQYNDFRGLPTTIATNTQLPWDGKNTIDYDEEVEEENNNLTT